MHTTVKRPCNHPLHAVLSAVTCGMWLPVWAVAAALGRRETITHHPVPPYPPPGPPAFWYVDPETGQWRSR